MNCDKLVVALVSERSREVGFLKFQSMQHLCKEAFKQDQDLTKTSILRHFLLSQQNTEIKTCKLHSKLKN